MTSHCWAEFIAYFDGKQFRSKSVQVAYYDNVGIMCLGDAAREKQDMSKKLREQSESHKAGYEDADAAYFAQSFSCDLPPQFCKNSDPGDLTNDKRLLPQFPTFCNFDSRIPDTSNKSVILRSIRQKGQSKDADEST